ncbi:MAG: 30S ribosomal protein S9 [Candidatus Nanoarchaeia archaeon]|nr:30S ribosomal protein S9 [Candidatus Nanoarchaeia archaeon]
MKVINTIGKRKCALAKASLSPGKGNVRINSVLLKNYTPVLARERINEAILLAEDDANKVDINVNVKGGGYQGQNEAARLAIARAFVKFNKKLKEKFLKYDRNLLVADIRRKEQYKPNDSKARAKRQKSYR